MSSQGENETELELIAGKAEEPVSDPVVPESSSAPKEKKKRRLLGGKKKKKKGGDDDAVEEAKPERHALLTHAQRGDTDQFKAMAEDMDVEKLNTIVDDLGWTSLHYASQKGRIDIVQYLLDRGVTVDIQDGSGSTPLYRAVGFGHLDVIKLLVKHGADVSAQNNAKANMIHNSAWAAHEEITRYLIEQGASYTAPDSSGRSPMIDLIEKLPELTAEILDERRRVVSYYLQHVQVEYEFDGLDDQDPTNKQPTPLETIISMGRLDLLAHPVIRTLLQFKWDSFAKDEFLSDLKVYIFVLFCLTFEAVQQTASTSAPWEYSHAGDYVRAVCEIVVVLFAFKEIYEETLEFRGSGMTHVKISKRTAALVRAVYPSLMSEYFEFGESLVIRSYFTSGWNLFDLTAYLSVVSLGVVRILSIADVARDLDVEINLLSLSCVILWVKLLQLAGVFRTTGPLVKMISRMMIDFGQFLIIYSLFLLGFSLGFYVLLAESAVGPHEWSTFPRAVMATFRLTIGDFDYGFIEDSDSGLAIVWFVVAVLLLLILMLNLLIALLSNSFGLVYYVAEKQWLHVWGTLILKTQRKIGKAKVGEIQDEYLRGLHNNKATIVAFATPAEEGNSDLRPECFFRWESDLKKEEDEELSLQLLRTDLAVKFSETNTKLEESHEQLQANVADLTKQVEALTKLVEALQK